jgi:hypothetical protein
MAGSAFTDARVVEMVRKEFVAVLVDTRGEADAAWVREHGVQLTPHLVVTDGEGEQWGFLSDVHGADEVLAMAKDALDMLRAPK